MTAQDEKITSQSKWNKAIKVTRPSLWLIRAQTLASKSTAMPAKSKPGTGKKACKSSTVFLIMFRKKGTGKKRTRDSTKCWTLRQIDKNMHSLFKVLLKVGLCYFCCFVCLCIFCRLFVTVCHVGFWCFASPPFCMWGELELMDSCMYHAVWL